MPKIVQQEVEEQEFEPRQAGSLSYLSLRYVAWASVQMGVLGHHKPSETVSLPYSVYCCRLKG